MTPFRRDLLVAALILLTVLGLSARQLFDEFLLLLYAQDAEATVISKQSGHGWIEYSYVVAGQTYEGKTPAISTGRSFDKVVVGDKVRIRFDPTHPSASGTSETRDVIVSTAPLLMLLGALIAGGVTVRQVMRAKLRSDA